MREIKFRAWVDNEIIEGREAQMYDVLNYCWKPSGDTVDLWFNLMPIRTLETEWVKLMQYIGLKDKNGNGIYEGDLIIYSGNHPPHYYSREDVFEVEWVLGQWVGTRIKDKTQPEYVGGNHLRDWLLQSDREVIGNIHENKELLDERKDRAE